MYQCSPLVSPKNISSSHQQNAELKKTFWLVMVAKFMRSIV